MPHAGNLIVGHAVGELQRRIRSSVYQDGAAKAMGKFLPTVHLDMLP
jgi:hypothetical protein